MTVPLPDLKFFFFWYNNNYNVDSVIITVSLQELEAGIYSQRQTLLAEMESLKLREAEMKRQAELDKKMLAMERERVKMREEQLATRETTLQHAANEKTQK